MTTFNLTATADVTITPPSGTPFTLPAGQQFSSQSIFGGTAYLVAPVSANADITISKGSGSDQIGADLYNDGNSTVVQSFATTKGAESFTVPAVTSSQNLNVHQDFTR